MPLTNSLRFSGIVSGSTFCLAFVLTSLCFVFSLTLVVQTFGVKVCRPFLTILLGEEVTNLRNKHKGESKLKSSEKEEEGVSTKKSKTETCNMVMEY